MDYIAVARSHLAKKGVKVENLYARVLGEHVTFRGKIGKKTVRYAAEIQNGSLINIFEITTSQRKAIGARHQKALRRENKMENQKKVEMMDLDKFSDEELKKELHRRKLDAYTKEFEVRQSRFTLLRDLLKNTSSALDALAPTHSGKGCSDMDPKEHGYISDKSFGDWCIRCALIELFLEQVSPHDVALVKTFELVFRPVPERPEP